jgi:hypothetical protein
MLKLNRILPRREKVFMENRNVRTAVNIIVKVAQYHDRLRKQNCG